MTRRVHAGLTFLLAASSASPALAHDGHLAETAMREWTIDTLVIVPLVATGILYAAGVFRLWRRAGIGKGISRWRVLSFAAGWVALAIALVSPVAWLSEILFSVHMTQHSLLMLVAAPLFVFGRPLFVWLWAFNMPWRNRIAGELLQTPVRRPWHALTAPLPVFLANAMVLWIWHVPSLYQAALRSSGVHALEHLCMVTAACAFWWGMVQGCYGRIGYGLAVLYVFLTGVHSSALGALLTVSPIVWYPDYLQPARTWHVDALADQQLAGLIMWIPAGLVFIVLGLSLFATWLGESERRVRLGETDAIARRAVEAGHAR